MKIVLMTRNAPEHYYFINNLGKYLKLAAVIQEASEINQLNKIINKFKIHTRKNNILCAVLKLLYTPYYLFYLWWSNRIIIKNLFKTKQNVKFNIDSPLYHVISVNSKKCHYLLTQIKPDVCIIIGTSIVNEHIIKIPKKGMINIHMGITPKYRGSRGEFWALYEGDYSNIGATIHFVDTGIDTGKIILQKTISFEPIDNEVTLRCKNIIQGVGLIVKAINQIEKDTVSPIIKEKTESILRATPTPFQYILLHKKLQKISKSAKL